MFRYASMPLGPVRLLTELGRALVKRGTEGTTERLRILKSGIKGNIDDFIAGLNAAPTGASQTQPLNIPVQWNAGISAKLPVKRRTVRYRAQRLQRQRLIKMARNVPTDALEAPTYAGLALISFTLLLATYSDRARIAIPDRSCAYPTETYGAILRICLTSISTEFQSLSTSPEFTVSCRADGHAVPALVVDIDIDHPKHPEFIQVIRDALDDFTAQGYPCHHAATWRSPRWSPRRSAR